MFRSPANAVNAFWVLVVSYTVRPPCGPATQVITSPWRIMAMRETDRPIVFRRVKAGQDFYIFPPTEFARLDRRMDNDNGQGRAYRQYRRENRVLQDRAEHAAQRYQACESAYNDLVDRLRRVTPQGGYDYQGPPPQGGWQNPNR